MRPENADSTAEDEMVRAPGRRDASGQQLALFLPIAGGRKVRGWRRRRDPIRLRTVWGSLSCPRGVEVAADGQRYVKTFKPLVDRWAGRGSDGNRAFGWIAGNVTKLKQAGISHREARLLVADRLVTWLIGDAGVSVPPVGMHLSPPPEAFDQPKTAEEVGT